MSHRSSRRMILSSATVSMVQPCCRTAASASALVTGSSSLAPPEGANPPLPPSSPACACPSLVSSCPEVSTYRPWEPTAGGSAL